MHERVTGEFETGVNGLMDKCVKKDEQSRLSEMAVE
jgi:hypothetical protein